MNKRISRSILMLLIAVFWLPTASVAQDISGEELDQLVESVIEKFDVPGIALGIVKDGELIHAKGYGVRSIESYKAVDENTLFGVASNSKAFTSAALAMLIDEKKLQWDDKVIEYIPEFRLYDPYVTSEFTIRDLLTHRSGLGLGAGDLMIFPDSADFSMDELIFNLRYLKPVSSFRSKYDYDNLLYIVAGQIVSRVSGVSWEEFVETKIMKPLGMNQSAGNYDRIKTRENIASPHAPADGELVTVAPYTQKLSSPAAGIYSNINDMSKWVICQLNQGVFNEDEQLFSKQRHQEMWTPQTLTAARKNGAYNTHFKAYGLGWVLEDVKGQLQVSHTGGLAGMVTQVTLLPEMKLGIIVLTNQQSGSAFTSITNTIKDHYLGISGTDHVKENHKREQAYFKYARNISDKVWEEINSSDTNLSDYSPYLGTYRDSWFGNIRIIEKEGGYEFVSDRSPKLSGTFIYYKANSFIVKWHDRSMEADAYAIFRLNEKGEATGFSMKAISPITDFSFDFQDLEFTKIVN